jgi:hypothetical protein
MYPTIPSATGAATNIIDLVTTKMTGQMFYSMPMRTHMVPV